MTLQQIFDTSAAHLLTQKARSSHFNSGRYRGDDGMKCSVGCLFSDELYDRQIEGVGVLGLHRSSGISHSADCKLLRTILEKSGIELTDPVIIFLDRLQELHDTQPPEIWHTLLCELASEHALNTNALTSFQV